MPDIIIIGGGITGVASALHLSRAGASVLLLEARGLAGMASGWTLGGVRQSGRDLAELPLALEAVKLWQDLDTELDGDVEYRQHGNLRLARSEAETGIIRALVAQQQQRGLDLRFIDGNRAVRDIAPALAQTVLAASYCPSDGHANPVKTVTAFAGAARRAGTEIREGFAVRRILQESGRVIGVETGDGAIHADRVVVAAGVHTPELLAPLGLNLPFSTKIVSVLQSVPLPPVLNPVFGVANADCAGRQEADGRLCVTTGIGDWPFAPGNWQPDALQPSGAVVAQMIERIGAILPILRESGIASLWGGLIDLTPDGLPVIEACEEIAGLVIAAGFSGHGFGIGPMVGKLVAQISLGEAPALPLDAFRLARLDQFVGQQSALSLHG